MISKKKSTNFIKFSESLTLKSSLEQYSTNIMRSSIENPSEIDNLMRNESRIRNEPSLRNDPDPVYSKNDRYLLL